MSRLLVAAAVTLTGFIALPKEANPEVTVTAPTLARPIPLRASRSVRRHPLPHHRHRRPVVTSTPTPVAVVPTPTSTPNFAALALCEAGGNPHAVDPSGTYFGLYQFDVQTWAAMGGHGNPADASPAEQTYRAELLYRERGTAPWPTCGWHLLEAS